MQTNVPLSDIPTWLIVVGVVVGIAQITFEIWALVDMLKRPAEQLNLGGRKWLWAIIILFVNWIGAIVYLAAGRKPAPAVEVAPATAAGDRASAAADALYGAPRGGAER